MKFVDFVDQWKSVYRLNVSDGWKLSQDQMIRDYISPFLDNLELKKITHLHISKVIASAQSRNRSPQTIKHIYSVVNKIFGDALDSELIEKSPVKPRVHRPLVSTVERDYLIPDEAKILLNATRADPFYGLPIWIQTFCGLRIGEVQGLKWGDVDWQNMSLLIRRTFNSKTSKFQEYTKNKTQIRVPIPQPLFDLLRERRGVASDFICKSHGGKFFSRHTYCDALPRICRQHGLKELSSHELRHTCSELWIHCGASAEDIRRLLNHKSLSSTKTYIHRSDSRLQALAKVVNCGIALSAPLNPNATGKNKSAA